MCTVCREACEDGGVVLACGHVFHAACVYTWLRVADTCPVCRRRVGVALRLRRLRRYAALGFLVAVACVARRAPSPEWHVAQLLVSTALMYTAGYTVAGAVLGAVFGAWHGATEAWRWVGRETAVFYVSLFFALRAAAALRAVFALRAAA